MRKKLSNRRMSQNIRFDFKGHTYFITYGISSDLTILEVFGNSARISSDMDYLIADACIILSLALQHGTTLDELAKSLKKVPDMQLGKEVPGSLVGVIVDHLISEQVALDALAEANAEEE